MAFLVRFLSGALATGLTMLGTVGSALASPPMIAAEHVSRSVVVTVEHRERYAPLANDEDDDSWFEADRQNRFDDDEEWEPYRRQGRAYELPDDEEERYEPRYGRYERGADRYRNYLERQKEAIKAQRKAQKEYLKAQARAWRQQYRY